MKGRHIILGVLWYVAGAVTLLIIALVIGGNGLSDVVDAGDIVALIGGAVLIGMAALAVQKVEVRRPTPATRGEGSRPRVDEASLREDFSWSSLAAIFGAAMALAITPQVEAEEQRAESARGTFEKLIINGDRDNAFVRMRHNHIDEHLSKTGFTGPPCARCHHLNLPDELGTPCAECHTGLGDFHSTAQRWSDLEPSEQPAKALRDDGAPYNSIFDHDFHAQTEGGNDGCRTCHEDPDQERSFETARACVDCHSERGSRSLDDVMIPASATIEWNSHLAPSYAFAMHELCMDCHRSVSAEHAQCSVCHLDAEGQRGPRRTGHE